MVKLYFGGDAGYVTSVAQQRGGALDVNALREIGIDPDDVADFFGHSRYHSDSCEKYSDSSRGMPGSERDRGCDLRIPVAA